MPTLTFGLGGRSASRTISTAHAQRAAAALKAHYGVETDDEAFDALAAGVFASIKDIVLRVERDAAVQQADASVTPIDLT